VGCRQPLPRRVTAAAPPAVLEEAPSLPWEPPVDPPRRRNQQLLIGQQLSSSQQPPLTTAEVPLRRRQLELPAVALAAVNQGSSSQHKAMLARSSSSHRQRQVWTACRPASLKPRSRAATALPALERLTSR